MDFDLLKVFEIASENELKLINFFDSIPIEDKVIYDSLTHKMEDGGNLPTLNKDGRIDGKYYQKGKELTKEENIFKKGVTFITSDGRKGFMTEYVQIGRKRLATKDDFQNLIEFTAKNRNSEINDVFINILIKDVLKWIELHENNTDSEKTTNYKILTLANDFLEYLKNYTEETLYDLFKIEYKEKYELIINLLIENQMLNPIDKKFNKYLGYKNDFVKLLFELNDKRYLKYLPDNPSQKAQILLKSFGVEIGVNYSKRSQDTFNNLTFKIPPPNELV